MNVAMPAARVPDPDGAGDGIVGVNAGMRDWKLEIAVAMVTDFAGYSDSDLRDASNLVMTEFSAEHVVYWRAERVLEALAYPA